MNSFIKRLMILLIAGGVGGQVTAKGQFKIVYAARPYTICEQKEPFRQIRDREGTTWLKKVSKDYHATGIKLIIDWSLFYELGNPKALTTRHLLKTIDAIKSEKLDLYVAVKMSSIPGFIVDRLKPDDLQLTVNRGIAKTPNHTPLMNFASENAQQMLAKYYVSVLNMLNRFDNVVEVVPNFSWDAETEYPYQMVTGYSKPMIKAFREFLQQKHGSISELHKAWQLTSVEAEAIPGFEAIVPHRSWGEEKNWFADFNTYTYPYGRLEWIKFKTNQLSVAIKAFAELNKPYGYQMPIQIGCTFDSYIERRGWIDFTELIEFSDGVRVADIAGREDSFDFHANYIRSMLNYWEWRRGDDNAVPLVFSTESNWPGYAGKPSGELVIAWENQLLAFFERGADAHFVYGWSDHKNPNLLLDAEESYKDWRKVLKKYKNRRVVEKKRLSEAAHFSSFQAAITHGYDQAESNQILNRNLMVPYDKAYEILTDFMFENSPEYVNLFAKVSFPAPTESIATDVKRVITSGKISSSTVLEAKPTALAVKMIDSAQKKPVINQEQAEGLPLYFRIWRMRPDLFRLFPEGNKANKAEAERINWRMDQGFIDWCVKYGTKEYDNLQISYANWHPAATEIWQSDAQIQSEFPDGYHSVNQDGYTFLDYLVALGNGTSDLRYAAFRNWPYTNTDQ